MRKLGYVSLAVLVAALLLLPAGQSQAITSKKCTYCHTMHNSQDGDSMLVQYRDSTSTIDGDPQGALIKYTTCAGCHINNSGTETILYDTPIVMNTTGYPATALAGGNFALAPAAENPKAAHNCAGLPGVVADSALLVPPGFATGYTDPSKKTPHNFTPNTGDWGPSTWTSTAQVTCAGEYGCHGDRTPGNGEFAAIRGSHHANGTLDETQVCTGASTPLSYRFLAGIKGAEQNNGVGASSGDSYEYAAAAAKHNGYYGVNSADRSNADYDATISFLCAECHGVFHDAGASGIGTASPWLRHPTDIAMPATKPSGGASEFAAYIGAAYDPVVPVGFVTNVDTNVTTATVPATAVVLCVSCHRAHGSENDDLLRWKYSLADWGGVEVGDQDTLAHSCMTCHTAK
jgi:hypothetical protein